MSGRNLAGRLARRASAARLSSISVLLQSVIGVMAGVLIATFAVSATLAYRSEADAARGVVVADVMRDVFDAMKYLRIERGTVSTALAAADPASEKTRREIAALRAQADGAFRSATRKLDEDRLDGIQARLALIRKDQAGFRGLRAAADAALLLPRERRPAALGASWLSANNALVNAIDDLSESLAGMGDSADVFGAEMMSFKRLAWLTSDAAGMDRLMIGVDIANGNAMSSAEREAIARQSGRIITPWRIIRNEVRLGRAPAALAVLVHAADKIYFVDICNERKTIVADLSAGQPSPVSYDEWLRQSKLGLDHVLAVANMAVDLAAAHAAGQAADARRLFYTSVIGALAFSAFGLFALLFVARRIVHPMEEITETIREVAGGNLDIAVRFDDRSDEVGDLARALGVFRANAIEKKRIEAELIKSKDTAESSNRAKSQFLANMSHELRTPLNAVIGFADMMASETFGPLGSPRYGEYANAIRTSGAHLLALINDILDLSRLDAGQSELIEDELDVAEVAEISLTMIAEQAKSANLVLKKDVADGLPPLRADRRRVKQVLINLLANAAKFTPAGGEVKLSAAVSRSGELVMSVADTGIGIAKDDIPKALERFGQIDSKLSRRYEGAGLGLPLAKQLMELHGGSLVLESELHVGTVVTVTFPRERLSKRAKVIAT